MTRPTKAQRENHLVIAQALCYSSPGSGHAVLEGWR